MIKDCSVTAGVGESMLLLLMAFADSEEERQKIEELYEVYQGLMFATAYKILKHKQNAEDAVLASWEKIICHLEKISDISCKKTRSYIVIIVERTSIDMYRKLSRSREVLTEFEETPYYAVKDPELEQSEVVAWIHSLPKTYAEVLMLYYVNDCSLREIGELLSVTEATVSRRLKKAKQLLEENI